MPLLYISDPKFELTLFEVRRLLTPRVGAPPRATVPPVVDPELGDDVNSWPPSFVALVTSVPAPFALVFDCVVPLAFLGICAVFSISRQLGL